MAKTHLEDRYKLLEQLASLVPKMRSAQIEYFKTRDRVKMQEAVSLEAKVDEVCKRLDTIKLLMAGERPGQAQMFS